MQILEGGTDAAAMLIFDPAALPHPDGAAGDDPSGPLRRLHEEGRAYWLDTQADGAYALGVCVGEGPPERLAPHARPLGTAERFEAPGGTVRFAGVEDARRRDDAAPGKNAHMAGSSCQVPAGTYRLAVYEMFYPESFGELWRERASLAASRADAAMGLAVPTAVMGGIAAFLGLLSLGPRLWAVTLLPLGAAMALPAVLIRRSRAFREAERAREEVRREHPDYVAVLSPVVG